MTSPSEDCDRELLERCNESELYQSLAHKGLVIAAGTPKEKLITYLLGEEEPPELEETSHPISVWRLKIMSFLLNHWTVVSSQLVCPAKSGDPRACFQCVDAQVVYCVTDNKKNEPLIAAQRLVR